jgi:hypothetical protein
MVADRYLFCGDRALICVICVPLQDFDVALPSLRSIVSLAAGMVYLCENGSTL